MNLLRKGIAATLLSLAIAGAHPAGAQTLRPTVVELQLNGVVDPFTASYLSSGIAEANREQASAVLITIDTPGGLDSSMREIIQSILNSNVPVICFVYPQGARAASAGTFIMMSCPVAAMAPGTNIGAAHPVGVSGAIEQTKVLNDASAYIRSLAELRGRNADWAEQAVRNSVSLSAGDALDQNVIDLIEPDVPALLAAVNGRQVTVAGNHAVTIDTSGATIRTIDMGLGASILHALISPDFAFLFFWIGLILIVIEILHPGISVPGILGGLFLIGAFVSFGMLPVQLIGLALLAASVVFFLIELKHPGFGVPTVGGVITLVFGGLVLFNPAVPNARVSLWLIGTVAAAAAGFFVVVVGAVIRARRMKHTTSIDRVLGEVGTVLRPISPKGVVRIGAEQWTAVAPSGRIPKDSKVKVVGVDGLKLKVEPLSDETSTNGSTGEGSIP